MSLNDLKEEILTELITQLEDEVGFKEEIVQSKLNIAFREVLQARTMKFGGRYPSSMSEEEQYNDLSQFTSHIFNLALFEFQTSSTENSTTRTYRDRNRLFNGIVPLSRLV